MKMGYLLIVAGVLLVISGTVLVCCKKNTPPDPEVNVTVAEMPVPAQSQVPEEKSSKEKGNDFEGYIADILKQNSIEIKEWNQGAVSPQGNIAENALNPDFFVSQPDDKMNLEYWVEAKWRASFPDEFSISPEQYSRYKEKQRTSKRKIILALGFEGSPSAPKSVYFIPLDSMKDGKIAAAQVRHYYLSNPDRDFAKRMNRWFHNEVFKKK